MFQILWRHWHSIALIFVFGCVLLLAFWIRVQGGSQIPSGQFTGYDAYLYYWQAQIVSEQGHLPERDMHRWLPLGRDLGQTLNLYSYVLAYVHKTLALYFPNLSLYEVALYAPVVWFVIGLAGLCLFLYRTHGLLFASIVGVILATLPGTIDRSSVGFADRDSWCLMLGILAITTYLSSLQTPHPRRQILWILASGVVVFLGGLSWEAFGFFVVMILAVEIWKFCSTEKEQHLKAWFLWVLLFVPPLYLASPAYRSGYGFSAHVAAFLLIPPLVFSVLRGVRYLLLHFSERLRPYARQFAWVLTLSGIALGLCYIVLNSDTFAHTAYPFRENRLMRSVGELARPRFSYWGKRYGSVFVLGSLGLVIESLRLWKWKGVVLGFSLTLFFATTFFRFPLSNWIGAGLCNRLFFTALVLVFIGLGIACLRRENVREELVTLILIVWALLWISLAREGKRYDFFIGVPLAFGTASLLGRVPALIIQTLRQFNRLPTHLPKRLVTAGITIPVLGLVLFWAPLGGHAKRAIQNASWVRNPVPGRGETAAVFQWMKASLPKNAVVAANWEFGSQLNVLAGVKTITDQDHFLPHWIHLYYRHVFCAASEGEALSFLKTHGATHLMLTQKELITLSGSHSFIGSNKSRDRHFKLVKLQRDKANSTAMLYRMIPQRGTPLEFVEFDVVSPEKLSVTVHFKTQKTVSEEIAWNANKPSAIELGTGGLVFYFDFEGKPYIGYYIPPLGWNSLAVKLFLRDVQSPAFVPVYPMQTDDIIKFKVWEIHYAPDIRTDPKYLKTAPGE